MKNNKQTALLNHRVLLGVLGTILVTVGIVGVYDTVAELTPDNKQNVKAFHEWCSKQKGYLTSNADAWIPPRHKCLLRNGTDIFYTRDWLRPDE